MNHRWSPPSPLELPIVFGFLQASLRGEGNFPPKEMGTLARLDAILILSRKSYLGLPSTVDRPAGD